MTTATGYTRTITYTSNPEFGTLVIHPLTLKKQIAASESLARRSLSIKVGELTPATFQSGPAFAFTIVEPWTDPNGNPFPASTRMELLLEYSSLLDDILRIGRELNELKNAGVKLEEKNS
jgi:hypothetical protein